MPNVFDVIPNGFFNCLASGSNNRIYADCLMLIYSAYEEEVSYKLPRKEIRDMIALYLKDNNIASTTNDEDLIGKTETDMATIIIRRLSSAEIGWLEEETDDATYEKQIIISEQGIMLAEFLGQLIAPEREEYASYIFNIYNTLTNEVQWINEPYSLCLVPVYKNSRNLANALKKLSTFIRKTIEELMNENTFESLTENIINYCDGEFIKEYARLTNKQNNIHTYRHTIINKLQELKMDGGSRDTLIAGCAAEYNISEYDAKEKVLDMIDKTERFLNEEYSKIMENIKGKINLYLQIAIARGRFLRNNGTGIKDSVEQTLRYLAEEMDMLDAKELIPDEMMDLIALETNDFMDLSSLWYKGKERIIKEPIVQTIEPLSEDDILEAQRAQLESSYNPYSRDKMKIYLDKMMEGRDKMNSTDLPLNTKRDLLANLSAVAYSRDNGYNVTVTEGYTEVNNMLFKNFEIRRRL